MRKFGLSRHPASGTSHIDHKEPRYSMSTIHAWREYTKWQVASITAFVFDPLGLVSFTVIIQECVDLKY